MFALVYSVPLCIVWILLIAAGYFRVVARSAAGRLSAVAGKWSNRTAILVVASLAALVRMVPAILLSRGAVFDIDSYSVVARLLISHHDVYASAEAAGRYPYLPLQLYFSALSRLVADSSPIPFVVCTKIPPILADVLISVIIFKLSAARRGIVHGVRFALLYALSPVSILVSAYHGQFDSIPLLFVLLAWWCVESSDSSSIWIQLISGTLLGVAVLDKTWPILLIPVFILSARGLKNALLFVTGTALPTLAACAVYILLFQASPVEIVFDVISYRSAVGRWGYTALLSFYPALDINSIAVLNWLGPLVTVALMGFAWLVSRRAHDRLGLIILTLLVFYVSTAGFGVQYLVWIVPFAILAGQIRQLTWFVAGALVFLVTAYFGYEITPILPAFMSFSSVLTVLRIASLPAWIVTSAWFAECLTGAVVLPAGPRRSSWLGPKPVLNR